MHVIGMYVRAGLFWERVVNWYNASVIQQLLAYFTQRYFTVQFHIYEHIPLGPSANETARLIILAVALGMILASVFVCVTKTKHGRFVRRLLREECLSPEHAKTLTEIGMFRSTLLRHELSRGTSLRKCVYCVTAEAAALPDPEEEIPEEPVEAAQDAETTSGVENAPEGKDWSELTKKEKKKLRKELRKKHKRKNAWQRETIILSPIHKKYELTEDRKLDFTEARFYVPEELKYRADVRYERRGIGWVVVLLTVVVAVIGAAWMCRLLPDFVQLMDNIITMTAPKGK